MTGWSWKDLSCLPIQFLNLTRRQQLEPSRSWTPQCRLSSRKSICFLVNQGLAQLSVIYFPFETEAIGSLIGLLYRERVAQQGKLGR